MAKTKISDSQAVQDVNLTSEVSGELPVANGGTGASAASGARTNLGLGNVDNTSDATKQSATLLAAFPIGSIYINTSSTNPGTFLGGTWTAFGTGRTLVGFDSGQTEFDTDEETGGAKTHTLTVAEMPAHKHNLTITNSAGSSSSNVKAGVSGSPDSTNSNAMVNNGNGDPHNNLQPYIVVRFWKRTA